MQRTIFDKTTGEIVSSADLSDAQLNKLLAEQPNLDYINVYTAGVKNIAVDPVTKKLKKLAPKPVDIAGLIRQRRLGLLTSSDWTQTIDSPLSESKRAEWAAYRQALRDMTDNVANVNSIDDVVWPTPPQ
jgi:hypothetical protein